MEVLRSNSALFWALEKARLSRTLLNLPLCWGPSRMEGLRSNSALFWAPEKARVRQPLLILSSLLGTPEK